VSWLYLAGPLFTQAEIVFNETLATQLRAEGYRVYLPQQECAGTTDPKRLFDLCLRGLKGANLVLVILDGPDADSGSCFEMGYAYARQIPLVGLRTDFRGTGEDLGLNLMLTQACDHLLLTSLADLTSTPRVTYLKPGADFLPRLRTVFSQFTTPD